MAEAQVKTAVATNLNIPEEVQKQFPKLIELIIGSQSMNNEERQYWIDVLPIMAEDQINNLREILVNEKKQTKEANREFEERMEREKLEFDESKYREKKRERVEAETLFEKKEKEREEALLKELEGIY